ncbi:hypothetical protein V3O24_01470, partial [Methylobacter sp. Wu8]|uniref:hypothetical protein n=1 Tax=Methylobacter sp. Wu8 TaxID=3118457 RepID=UPI002F32C2F9
MPPALLRVTVAVFPDSETPAVMLLLAVVTELPWVNATLEPSMLRISAAPSVTLLTVSTSCSMLSADSTA